MRPKSRSSFCHVSVTPSQMTGCFEQKKDRYDLDVELKAI